MTARTACAVLIGVLALAAPAGAQTGGWADPFRTAPGPGQGGGLADRREDVRDRMEDRRDRREDRRDARTYTGPADLREDRRDRREDRRDRAEDRRDRRD